MMIFWRDDDRLLTRYLLGELSESRRTRLEERLLADEAFYERLVIAEDELIDAYVRNDLAADARPRFEARFLTSLERLARIETARDLKAAAEAALDRKPENETARAARDADPAVVLTRLWRRPAVAAAAAVVVLIATALLWRPSGRQESGSGGSGQLAVATVTLYPSVRSETAGLPRLELTDTIGLVELKAWVEEKSQYRDFRAHLKTGRGEALWSSGKGLEVESTEGEPTVVLRLPADVFKRPEGNLPGVRHVLTLRGMGSADWLELVDKYEFIVTR